eukprot:TRINITY_DN5763_c0_g1_i9.p1 TRINITY_DN5763_c0_g1~~TRINITY_DN5763_c0_g1_i9.p1  ORF type:complete len:217 (+),score=17.02 TRINITY_DN5763_c0_g1_i9:131-781(+)
MKPRGYSSMTQQRSCLILTNSMVWSNGSKFYYVERSEDGTKDTIVTHSLTDYPKEFQRKVTLLQHFRSYLEADMKGRPKDAPEAGGKSSSPVYVKKWMRTKHAVMFRLSNKIVQVNFEDRTQVVFCAATQKVHYRNKKGIVNIMPLSEVMDSTNEEMTKRVTYTKDVLMHIVKRDRRKGEDGILLCVGRENTCGRKEENCLSLLVEFLTPKDGKWV